MLVNRDDCSGPEHGASKLRRAKREQGEAALAATFVSLIASAKLHGLEPYAYLRDLFCLLPTWPRNRVLELAPAYFNETLKREDVQERLRDNIFRAISVGQQVQPIIYAARS